MEHPFPPVVYTHATFKTWTPTTFVYDLVITTEDGRPLYSVDDLEISLHGQSTPRVEHRYEVVYHATGHTVALDEEAPAVEEPNGDAKASSRFSPVQDSSDSGYASPQEAFGEDKHHDVGLRAVTAPPTLVLHYKRGAEMEIQEAVKKLDALSPVSLWFHAFSGPNGDALVGFARALRKEIRSWSIHAVVLDPIWSENVDMIIAHLSRRSATEPELVVGADGSISVPKIVEAPPPPSQAQFQASLPWKWDGVSLSQISTPYVPPQHVLVHVTGAAKAGSERLWSFVGRADVDEKAQCVLGIASGALSNVVVAHEAALVEFSSDPSQSMAAPYLLSAAIAILAVGTAAFSRPERMHRMSVLVTRSDTDLAAQIANIYRERGADVFEIPTRYTPSQLKAAYTKRLQLIVSASQDDSEVKTYREMVSPFGKVFLWNDEQNGIARTLQSDPYLVGEVLRVATSLTDILPASESTLRAPLELLPSPLPASVPLTTEVFDVSKSYVLHGGIGSLGLQLAYWMYKNGARELLLTSRSGREGLLRRGDFAAIRLLDYLQTLPDLRLHVASTGRAPLERLQAAIAGLQLPVGGCFLLSGVLMDRGFLSQTEETFEAPFDAKVEAFYQIEQALPVDRLDFLVAFSSVSGMFGNAGQTNYASANTSLAGLTRKYRNAVCIVAPAILDTSTIRGGADASSAPRLKHLSNWGMTSSEFFTYVEDAIRCVADRPVWQYVPAFDWALVRANMGSSALFDDLVPTPSEAGVEAPGPAAGAPSLKDVVCGVLDIAPGDLSPDVPFTSYGLDSLSAAALSYALRRFFDISQLQLLADLSLRDLERRMQTAQVALAN